MNRIQLLAPETDEAAFDQQPATATQLRATSQYSLFAPLHYEANYAYPLLVWLHGPAGHERELLRVMPLISMRNYVAIAPRGGFELENGYDWDTTQDAVAAAEQQVAECIEIAQSRFNVAAHRVFVGGFSSGGTLAIRLALRSPDRFAGAFSACGSFPSGDAPLTNLAAVRHLPMLIAHGRDGEEYPVEQVCEELRLFHAAGLQVALRQYPGGDDLTTQMLHDIDVWMMEQVTGSPCDSGEQVSPAQWN